MIKAHSDYRIVCLDKLSYAEKLIPLMVTNALNDKPLPVYGKDENVRDWLYVEDHCKAIDLIIRKGSIGEVYNIGGHNGMRNIDIVKLARSLESRKV